MKNLSLLIAIFFAIGFLFTGCQKDNNPVENNLSGNSLSKPKVTYNVPNDYTTIQEAVNAISEKGTIVVEDGTYDGSVLIDGKDITLVPNGVVTLTATTPTSHGDVISVYNGKLNIDGFKIDATNCTGGIYAGGGIPVNDYSASVTVTNCEVSNYLKNGVTVNGSKASGDIESNTIWGSGPLGVPHYAQNGIQFGYGGTGTARDNEVIANLYTGPDWGATGILIFESSDVIAQNNIVKECGTGIAMETWGWYAPNDNNNKVDRNTIIDCQYGIYVAAYDLGGYSTQDAFAVNNKIINNTISIENDATDDQVGIGLWSGSYWGGNGTTPTVDNNKLITNSVVGYGTPVDQGGDTNSKVHANSYN